jgi:hypothetical protein
MVMNSRSVLRSACAFATFLMVCSSAQALLFRAYVASTGSDANPCTLPQPCRLLPAALTAVADGGEIWMLDSANFNTSTVNIIKSVTILAIPGAVGSVVATGGGDAIFIGTAGVKVTLRNLVIVHLTSSVNGIVFSQGAELNVSECEIANVQGTGIYAYAPGSKVTVENTVLRGNNSGFVALGSVVASLDNVRAKGNTFVGVGTSAGATVTVRGSVATGNQHGMTSIATSGTTSRLVIAGSVVTGNSGDGLIAQAVGAGDVADLTVSNSTVSNNGTGIWTNQNPSSTVTVVMDGNTLAENGVGVFMGSGPPIIYTRGNNTLKFNTPDITGGSLTALAAQ